MFSSLFRPVSSMFNLTLALFLSLNVVACSRFVDEKKDAPRALEQDSGQFACIKEVPEQISKFVKGSVTAEEINQGLDCGKNTLNYFSENTTGSLPEAYAPEDLRRFFGKYFLKENNFSVSLVAELFKLKKLFLGGSATSLTKAEIQKLVGLSDKLKKPLSLLAPHVPRLLIQAPSATSDELEAATAQWSQTLLVLASSAELMSSQYTFQDLKNLLSELNLFLKERPLSGLAKKVDENSVLIESAKNIFIGEVAEFSSLRDWNQAIASFTGLHLQFLRYHYFIDNDAKSASEKLRALSQMIDGGFKLLGESLTMKQQGRIPFKDIDGLLDILAAKKLLPFQVSVRAVKNLYKIIILRMLDSRRDPEDARDLDALERSHFMALNHEWRVFKLHQAFIDSLPFDSKDQVSAKALNVAAQKEAALREVVKNLSPDSLEQNRLWTSWVEGRGVLLQNFPVLTDNNGKAFMAPHFENQNLSRTSLAEWNLIRGVIRMMLRGYGSKTSAELFQNTIRVEGLTQWYSDFQEFGIEIKAFDPRNGNTGARSFKEANFFTFHGDGNTVMTATETFEFVSLLVSGGMVSANGLRNEMMNQGCGLGRLDVFGYPLLNETCFKAQLRSLIAKEFGNLPELVKEVRAMNDSAWNDFYANLMVSARVSAANGGVVETADLRTAVMILHYTESLMTVYDKNGNGRLDAGELALAAPRFQEFMLSASPKFVSIFAKFFPKKGSALVADFFSYLVYRGKKPEPPFFDYAVIFQSEKKRGSLGEVSRARIVRVFKILKDEAAKQ